MYSTDKDSEAGNSARIQILAHLTSRALLSTCTCWLEVIMHGYGS